MNAAERPVPSSHLREFTPGSVRGFRSAVSLHAHTRHSSESLVSVPSYIDRIPVVSDLFHRETKAYLARNGKPVDFAKGWWHPPFAPLDVLRSEQRQIEIQLQMSPLVSITDHDSISAASELGGEAPVSFEWTVPFETGYFHLGVHNLGTTTAAASTFAALMDFTRDPVRARLAAVLDGLQGDAGVLVVLNHPLWDLANVGQATHMSGLRRFLRDCRRTIHALELNGYRSWRENRDVCALAASWQLPLISGGDRHGQAPNSLLNLTNAQSFTEFAHEVRVDRRSEVLVMPEYRRSLAARKLAVAADVMRPSHSEHGPSRWVDRVTCEVEGQVRPLSVHWPGGGPLWVRSAIRSFRWLTSPRMLPLLGLLLSLGQGLPSGFLTPADVSTQTAASCELGEEVSR